MTDNKKFFVHPTAVIDDGAIIGEGTRIWHFSHIMTGSRIGQNCVLGQNVFVGRNVIIGNRVKIQNNVSVYEGVILEDEVFVGPSVVFTNVINPRAFIERKDQFRQTIVKRGATIGANAIIICGNTIGEYAFVGAGTVVTRNVKPFELVMGVPARHAGWVSHAGHRLNFDSDGIAVCPETARRYKLLEQGSKIIPL